LLTAFVSAQDVPKANTTSDSKIRNIDGVAAVVNTGYVTRKDIDDRIAALKKQGAKLPDDGSLRKVILERLILEKIQ
jgi:peptidyl-prolyl cis-trans isomerase SurA